VRANLDGVEVAPFGSFASGVHSIGSDIDISLEVSPDSRWAYTPANAAALPTPPGLRGKQGAKSLRRLRDAEAAERKKAKVRVLQRMFKVLLGAGMRQVQLIPRANVPLIKFVEPQSGVQVRALRARARRLLS
jgi:predicted nucleotidyltransferase